MPAPVAPSPIATPPDAPLRSDPTTFAAKREAWLAWEEDDLFPGLNTAVAYVDDGVAWVDLQVIAVAASASTATGAASAASTSAGNALTSENNASASASAAAGSASTAAGFTATSVSSLAIGTGTKVFAVGTGKSFQAGEYILAADQADPANYMHGLATGYTGGNLTVNVTSVGGSGTKAAWNVSLSGPAGPQGSSGSTTQLRSARTSNTKLVAADLGKLIDITSGTFPQTFDPAGTLGVGWWARITNNGSGVITLDADGTETIGAVNAATTSILNPGQSAVVVSDGANLYFSDAPTPFRNMQVFTSSGTFTPKPGVTRYHIRLKAPGGGGGGAVSGNVSGGGEGGEVSGFVDLTSAQTVTLGAPGTGGTSSDGTDGGNSTFGALATANGGKAGRNSGGAPGLGGDGTMTGGLVERGAPGTSGLSASFGGSGGGKGGGTQNSLAGVNGGGGAGNFGGTGGAGGAGFCIVTW